MEINEIKMKLKNYNQEHLLVMIEKLDDNEKEILLNQIKSIDFDQITKLYQLTLNKEEKKQERIEPIKYVEKTILSDEKKEEYYKIGKEIIIKQKLAVVTMAGGQGTRLRT